MADRITLTFTNTESTNTLIDFDGEGAMIGLEEGRIRGTINVESLYEEDGIAAVVLDKTVINFFDVLQYFVRTHPNTKVVE